MSDVIHITDALTRADLAEAMAGVNARAKRVPHVLGTPDLPTEWDRRHQQLDLMLSEWLAAT